LSEPTGLHWSRFDGAPEHNRHDSVARTGGEITGGPSCRGIVKLTPQNETTEASRGFVLGAIRTLKLPGLTRVTVTPAGRLVGTVLQVFGQVAFDILIVTQNIPPLAGITDGKLVSAPMTVQTCGGGVVPFCGGSVKLLPQKDAVWDGRVSKPVFGAYVTLNLPSA